MKLYLLLIFFWVNTAFASQTVFTTVFYDDFGIVYLGAKQTSYISDNEIKKINKVVSFQYPNTKEFTRIDLPPDALGREIIGVLPDREKLFVITHSDTDKRDGPHLHLYNTKKKIWKKLGAVECPAFTKVKITTTKFVFFCEQNTKRGTIRISPKVLRLGKERIYRSGYMRFPEFLLRYKGVTFTLEGKAPDWNLLRIKTVKEKGKLFQAEELFGGT